MNRSVRVLLFLLLLTCVSVAHAAAAHWRTYRIDYVADSKDVKDVLRDFAASEGIAANISGNVSGVVTGKFQMSPQRFLDTLAASFGFVWYYDGLVLDIVPPEAMRSQVIKLDHASTGALREMLAQMNVSDPRFQIRYDDAHGTAIVNGPPDYVRLVAEIAGRLDATTSHRAGTTVRVFPLYHAWAEDRTVNVDGASVTLPGVATVLNYMYHPGSAPPGGAASGGGPSNVTKAQPLANAAGMMPQSPFGSQGGLQPPLPPSVAGAAPKGGGAGENVFASLTGSVSPQLAAALGPSQSGAAGASQQDGSLPVIEADQRTNSVLIRDTPDRMDQYPALISRLDVKPQLVEIEVHIFEVDDDAISQLGVNWSAHNSHIDLQTGNGTGAQNVYNGSLSPSFGNTTLAGGVSAAAAPAGAALTTVLGDAGRYLLANVEALSQSNKAKIEASPKVATLDNVEADMTDETQFFVRVSGYTSADLYSVQTGVSLRVLPMVEEEDGQTRIKLDVSIRDGQLTGQTVDNIPVISNSTINTSAFVDEGEALLVAGYRTRNQSTGVTGVPGLSKIPVLGALFRSRDTEDSRMERLFLVTPHIIAL